MIPLLLVLTHIIDPVLDLMEAADPGVRSDGARYLLLGTGLKESHYNTRIQKGGPARSLWQIEKPTHDDVVARYFGRSNRRLDVLAQLGGSVAVNGNWPTVVLNDWYACAIARGVYRFRPGVIPAPHDAAGMGRHWKQYYNTPAGAGIASSFTELYTQHVLPLLSR